MKMKLFATTLVLSAAMLAGHAQAINIVWDALDADGASGDGTSYGDAGNWIGGVVPGGSDTIQLEGATVTVFTNESYNSPNATGDDGALVVANGGTLTATGGGFAVIRRISSLTVQNGGTFNAPQDGQIRADLIVDAGGVFNGSYRLIDSSDLTVSGLWRPLNNINDTLNTFEQSSASNTTIKLNTGGTIELDLFANAVNESFYLSSSASTLDIADGSINLILQDGYTPQIGDSFQLFSTNPLSVGTVVPGDGSNVTLAGYTLDTSTYASTGIVTVAVPEPTSVALLGLGGLMMLARRRNA